MESGTCAFGDRDPDPVASSTMKRPVGPLGMEALPETGKAFRQGA
jgi:hypothetical protein